MAEQLVSSISLLELHAAAESSVAALLEGLGLTPSEASEAAFPELVAGIVERALRIFGDHERALRWLRAAKPRLRGHTALEEARTKVGCRRVEEMLIQIEEGMVI